MVRQNDLFWQLVKKEHLEARAFCFRLTGSTDEGDDLYQESILKAHGGFPQLKNTASFRPWLYRIISNNYKARFRTPWWKSIIRGNSGVNESEQSQNPSELYDARLRLDFAFSTLSAEDKIIVSLAYLEGWKIAELAELTGLSEGVIKMRLMRSRTKMRRKLSASGRKKQPEVAKGSL